MKEAKTRVVTTDAEIDAAIAQAKVYERYRPKVVAAEYRAKGDLIAFKLASGIEIAIPRPLLQGLESASRSDVSRIEVEDYGSSLHWPKLGVDHYVPGLLEGIFGTKRWMAEIGRKGGTTRSSAKAKSSRANGRKGGRPKKRAA
jgi:hypothetical protein